MRKIRHLYLFILFIYFSQILLAQNIPDISGNWNGSAQVPLNDNLIIAYQFKQKGAVIEGTFTTKSLNQKDSAKGIFIGTIDENGIAFKGTKFIYKVGPGCLSSTKLTYENTEGQEKLTGTWSGDWSLNTCPPGTGGKVSLIKVKDHIVSTHQTARTTSIHTEDESGQSLYYELLERKYYALLIGIDSYINDEIQDLDHPVSDMHKLKEVLISDYSFTPEHTISLTNPSRDEIIMAFDKLSNNVTSKDQLLIFYAGHGIWDDKIKQGYWLPSDASKTSKARWLSNSTIRDYIGGIKSKHTLLITDACFSGGIFKERAVAFKDGRAMLEMFKLPSRKAMTSGTLSTVPDKSVFVHYLIKNLKLNTQPLLSSEDLFRNFKIAVINNSPNGQIPQYGSIGQTGDEGGDFIFIKKID